MIKILKHKSLWINILVAIAFVIALFYLMLYGLDIYTRHGEKIPVPNLYGLQVEEAENLLSEKGLRVTILDSLYVEDQLPNSVLEQMPDTGSYVKDNRMIYIRINKGQTPEVMMPDIEGVRIEQALITLESAGLKVGRIDTTEDIAEDAVVRWSYKGRKIQPDTKLPQGSVIDLVIADGNRDKEVKTNIPLLEGSTVDACRIIISTYGLVLGDIKAQGSISDTARATVISQSPSFDPNHTIPKGTAIHITIQQ